MAGQVRFLVDTNVWLERLLGQENAPAAAQFFDTVSSDRICMSDFALHSIGVILHRLKRSELLTDFVEDLFVHGSVEQVALRPEDFKAVTRNSREKGLDFDDAYQLTAVHVHGLTIVTFDRDFKGKSVKALSPQEAIAKE